MSWWIARAERTVTDDVPAPPDEVRAFYVDLDSLTVVHPLIVSVEELSRTDEADGYRQTYRVVDRVRMGPFSFMITYRAAWHVPEQGDVRSEADQSPGVRLRGTVSFTPIDGGTRITERLRISAPRPLAGYTTREAVKAHVAMLASIRAHFESA
ncbi:polyketide cyclase / dehydrase and lipid transport [Nocardioides sp. Root1257]|uniref:SRPBCC family protein n=1 Tax=unclassified Nocardioides TaxID=2615069 RepID=UPI0007021018|nr:MULTISPECIES: SRPBCC family protein [unclassified Nocardioides]KQW49042.1 polyketide cyclase / dehydrase and lipid transport [Nocardioides sp. Root1257]KRC48216.1 polyketide cyclase / dehydrase and lipid transport [Nocardioides sp. Root224]